MAFLIFSPQPSLALSEYEFDNLLVGEREGDVDVAQDSLSGADQPAAASSQKSSYLPLVQCGRGLSAPPEQQRLCTTCDLFRTGKNIIDFILIGLTPPVATLMIIIGGLMILLGGARPNLIQTGKKIFWDTIIGLVIIFSSWMITNTVLKTLAGDNDVAQNWYRLECRTQVTSGGIGAGGAGPGISAGDICAKPALLAQQNKTIYPRANAPELDRLMTCIRSELRDLDTGSVFTFDQTYELCNYTRGKTTCTNDCSHAVNSCHYGGSSGSEGALAVDYGNEKNGDRIIQAALRCGAKNGRCEDKNGKTVTCLSSTADHVHINSKGCDRN